MPQSTSRLLLGGLAFAVGVTLVLVVGASLFSGEPGEGPGMGPAAPGAAGTPRPAPTPETGPGDFVIASGQTLELAQDALPADGPLVLDLTLGVPESGAEPMDVRVIAFDRRLLHLGGIVDTADGLSTRIEIDPEWLAPGRYIIEVKTSERSHFPARRYALEIR